MKAELLGKRWSVSPLFFPLLIWMMAVRGSTDTAAFLLALFLHEGGQMLMAGAFGMEVAEIRLLPFGCAAKMSGIDFCDAHTEVFVAAAGPAVNLWMAALLLLWRGETGSPFVQSSLQSHVGMAAVNLLPVLPMDGGRIFCAALGLAVGRRRAERWSSVFGAALGGAAILWGGYLLLQRQGNWTLPLWGAFLLGSSVRGLREAAVPAAQWVERRRHLGKSQAARVRAIALDERKPLARALVRLDARAYTMVYVLDAERHVRQVLDEQTLVAMALQHGASARFAELLPESASKVHNIRKFDRFPRNCYNK